MKMLQDYLDELEKITEDHMDCSGGPEHESKEFFCQGCTESYIVEKGELISFLYNMDRTLRTEVAEFIASRIEGLPGLGDGKGAARLIRSYIREI